MSDAERLHTLIEGVFAGNIFDLVLKPRMILQVRSCAFLQYQGSFDTLKLFEQV